MSSPMNIDAKKATEIKLFSLLAGAALHCYEQLGDELGRLTRLLKAVVLSFGALDCKENQVDVKSINALVPGR